MEMCINISQNAGRAADKAMWNTNDNDNWPTNFKAKTILDFGLVSSDFFMRDWANKSTGLTWVKFLSWIASQWGGERVGRKINKMDKQKDGQDNKLVGRSLQLDSIETSFLSAFACLDRP